MKPSTRTLGYAAAKAAVLAPLKALRPPTQPQLAAAHRRGQDPNELIEEFNERYGAACSEYVRIADEIAGEDKDLRWRIAEQATAFALARRYEWWTAPQLHVAKLLNPGIRQRDLLRLRRMLRQNMYVGYTITVIPRGSGNVPAMRTPAGAVAAPRERRDSSSSRSSGQDPGDDPDPDGDPWALSFVDRAPVLWRFRAARSHILEIREAIRMGVDR